MARAASQWVSDRHCPNPPPWRRHARQPVGPVYGSRGALQRLAEQRLRPHGAAVRPQRSQSATGELAVSGFGSISDEMTTVSQSAGVFEFPLPCGSLEVAPVGEEEVLTQRR